MTPVFIRLPSIKQGDTWEGLSIGPVVFTADGTPFSPSQLRECRLYFRDQKSGQLGYGFKSTTTPGFGSIDITDADIWLITIPEQSLPLPAGNYFWDFETTDISGAVKTLYEGSLSVNGDITHD